MFAGLKIMSTFATQMRNKLTQSKCPDGGIGRRVGLKHQWIHFHPGSIPGLGTRKRLKYLIFRYLGLSCFRICSQNVPEYPSLNMPCSTFIYFLLIQFKYISSYFLHL